MIISSGIISSPPIATESDDTDELSTEVEWRKVVVANQRHAGRLDHALVDAAPEFSRSYLQQLIEAGRVTVNSHLVR